MFIILLTTKQKKLTFRKDLLELKEQVEEGKSDFTESALKKIEELFAVQNGRLDGARPRTWYRDNLCGRQFTQFVLLGYPCFLTKIIKQVQARLKKEEPKKSKSLIKLEKKLVNWCLSIYGQTLTG